MKILEDADKVIVAHSREGTSAQPLKEAPGEKREMKESADGELTTEGLFGKIMNLLREMGFRSLSVERSEDFTERIDVIFTRQMGIEEAGNSGYLRILTIYRIGEKRHIEIYNFLSKFPADNIEMCEVRQAIKNLFGKNPQLIVDVHE
jgi:hypothetical protein